MDAHHTCRIWFALISSLLAAGCANQNSIFRFRDTPPAAAETILIDAKQRPITVNTVSTPGHPQTCLGRNADALSQAAVSGNLKITQQSGGSGELSFGDVETATSLAFRTQVTEAQQEFLYYLCQLKANNVLTNEEVSSNLTHFQNTMLAMVAIDDLATSVKPKTGADTQKPPAAGTDPKAADALKKAQIKADTDKKAVTTTGAKVDTDAKVAAAVTTAAGLKVPIDSLSTSLKKYDTAQTTYATDLSKLSDAIKATKDKDAAVPDDVNSATSDAGDKSKDVKTAYTKAAAAVTALAAVIVDANVAAAQATLKQALADYSAAVKKAQDAEGLVAKNLTAWQGAGADGKTKDTTSAKADPAASGDSGASTAVANDVAIIVQTIVWQSFITEQCSKIMFEADYYKGAADEAKRFCILHLLRADDVREKQVLGNLLVGNNGKPQPPLVNFGLVPAGGPGVPANPLELFDFVDRGRIDLATADKIRIEQLSLDQKVLNSTQQALQSTTDRLDSLIRLSDDQLHALQQQNADQLHALEQQHADELRALQQQLDIQQSFMKNLAERKDLGDAARSSQKQP